MSHWGEDNVLNPRGSALPLDMTMEAAAYAAHRLALATSKGKTCRCGEPATQSWTLHQISLGVGAETPTHCLPCAEREREVALQTRAQEQAWQGWECPTHGHKKFRCRAGCRQRFQEDRTTRP
jgi:hypothetical protein